MDYSNLKKKLQAQRIVSRLENEFEAVVISGDKQPCSSADCPLLLRFEEDKSIQKPTLVIEKNEVRVKIRDQNEALPSGLDNVLIKILERRGHIVGHMNSASRRNINSVQYIHVV